MNKTIFTLTGLLIIFTFGLILGYSKTVPVYDSGLRGQMCSQTLNMCPDYKLNK